MPLDIFTDPEHAVNIKNFRAPEKEPQAHFDPQRDIPAEVWERFWGRIAFLQSSGERLDAVKYVAVLMRLDPEYHPEFSKENNLAQSAVNYLDIYKKAKVWSGAIRQIEEVAALQGKPPLLMSADIHGISATLAEARKTGQLIIYFEYYKALRSIEDKLDHDPLSVQEVNAFVALLGQYKKEGKWEEVVSAAIGFLRYQKANGLLNNLLTEEDWRSLREKFYGLTEPGSGIRASEFAADLADLSRLEQQFSSGHGQEDTPPLPPTRSF